MTPLRVVHRDIVTFGMTSGVITGPLLILAPGEVFVVLGTNSSEYYDEESYYKILSPALGCVWINNWALANNSEVVA